MQCKLCGSTEGTSGDDGLCFLCWLDKNAAITVGAILEGVSPLNLGIIKKYGDLWEDTNEIKEWAENDSNDWD